MVQTMKQEVFTVDAENLRCYAEDYDLKIGKLANNATSGYISVFIYTICDEILADSENFNYICYADDSVTEQQQNKRLTTMKENQLIVHAYERPAVEILEFAVECGFQLSPDYDGTDYSMSGESDNGTLKDGGIWY